MDLSSNKLTGTIPEKWFSNLTDLVALHLQNNSLNGTLPLGISSLLDLEVRLMHFKRRAVLDLPVGIQPLEYNLYTIDVIMKILGFLYIRISIFRSMPASTGHYPLFGALWAY